MPAAPTPADDAWTCKKYGMPAKQRIVRSDALGSYFKCMVCWVGTD
jgi:hypothetical protein